MEILSNYQKLNNKEIKHDPFEIITEFFIQERIFEYLTGNDIKNAFLVSKSWNKITTNSLTAMSKFKFGNVGKEGENLSDDFFKFKSRRRHQNIELKWICKPYDYMAFTVIRRHSDTLVELSLEAYNIKRRLAWPKTFPKLKFFDLDLENCSESIVNHLLDSTPNLEEVRISQKCCGWDFQKLANKTKLKKLSICSYQMDSYLAQNNSDPSSIKFQLESLEIRCSYQNSQVPAFLKMMAPTLTLLMINEFSSQSSQDVFDTIWLMPKLHSLGILMLDGKLDLTDIKPLPNIRRFKTFYFKDKIKVFITEALTNLKTLQFFWTEDYETDLKWSVQNIRSLKKVLIDPRYVEDDDFEKMIEDFASNNKNIEIKKFGSDPLYKIICLCSNMFSFNSLNYF